MRKQSDAHLKVEIGKRLHHCDYKITQLCILYISLEGVQNLISECWWIWNMYIPVALWVYFEWQTCLHLVPGMLRGGVWYLLAMTDSLYMQYHRPHGQWHAAPNRAASPTTHTVYLTLYHSSRVFNCCQTIEQVYITNNISDLDVGWDHMILGC